MGTDRARGKREGAGVSVWMCPRSLSEFDYPFLGANRLSWVVPFDLDYALKVPSGGVKTLAESSLSGSTCRGFGCRGNIF